MKVIKANQAMKQHFIAYEQETNRNPVGNVSSVSSNVDDKTLHELYLWYACCPISRL